MSNASHRCLFMFYKPINCCKIMKKIFLILLFISPWSILYSQNLGTENPLYPPPQNPANVERSMNNLPILSETRSMIEQAMGWTLQDDGKWISQENRILYSKAELNNSGKTFYKLGKENFEFMKLRKNLNFDIRKLNI